MNMSVSGVNVNEDMNKGKALPTGWRWVYLKDICSISANQVDPMLPEYSGLPHVGPENIESGSGKMMNVRSAATDGMISGKYLFKAGTVLYSKIRPYLRKAALAEMSGLCSADIYPLDTSNDIVDRQYFVWLLLSPNFTHFADSESRRARMPKINRDQLYSYRTILPPLAEQKRIAAILNEQMAAVERARTAAHAQLAAAKALPAAYLRQVFPGPGQELPEGWRWVKLAEIASLLPSKSIASDGDQDVYAVTTACLTESGFNKNGIKIAKMRSSDIPFCTLNVGEILIARSNTLELVGRASIFSGHEQRIVAPDLVIRIKIHSEHAAGFVIGYFSLLYISGYWRDHSGGASGSMKKITRTQIQNLLVPLPPIAEQKRIAALLNMQMAMAERTRAATQAQLDEINALPAAILRRAFSGEL